MRPSPASRRKAARERIERRRQEFLAMMDEDLRAEHAETDFTTLVCLVRSGHFNMLPGTQDL